MSEPELAYFILACPLAAAILAVLTGVCKLGKYAHVPVVLGFAAAAVASLYLLVTIQASGIKETHNDPLTWFAVGHLNVTLSLTIDPLAAVMLATVTFIATWIAVFSAGYMHDDPGYVRYFGVMALFVFSMCLLVLANTFLLLVAGWEGVGLCSYLLVGYYHAKPAAAAAARKAFLVTRLGDVGLILGVFLLWQSCEYATTLTDVFRVLQKNPPPTATLTAAALLLFCGAVGKSAQLPLYVWLPDAMEGPTPVSALIHAATMVTAGVYLLARCMPLFVLAPEAQVAVSLIGGATALLAAFIALTQTDLKRVLAYSTVSQLGYMFMALGTAGAITPSVAVIAAVFHLFTHAFFKALLFLGSGSVMHAMGGVIDVRKFGGLRKLMPVTHATFLCGAAALAGLPVLSGFWSKDQILACLEEAGEHGFYYRTPYLVVFGMALVTAGLTAFYTFRAYFLTFWGEERIPPEAGHHAHESPRGMRVPLIVLAVGAVLVGVICDPLTHGLGEFLHDAPSVHAADKVYAKAFNAAPAPHVFSWKLAAISTVVAGCGAGLAFLLYGRGAVKPVPAELEPLHALSRNKVYVDEIYAAAIVAPAEGLAAGTKVFDGAVDGVARLVALVPKALGAAAKPIQNGLVQFYALGTVLGLGVIVSLIVFRVGR